MDEEKARRIQRAYRYVRWTLIAVLLLLLFLWALSA